MRTLILTQHFAPEVTAARFRLEAFAHGLAARDHEVEVVCAVPNHPEGVIRDGYRGRPVVRRRVGEVLVSHVWVPASPRKTVGTRLATYGSYTALATTVAAVASRPDAVLASSPPLTVGLAGALVASLHGAPWVLDVRDLWPESASDLGQVGQGPLLAAAERLERALYGRADLVVTVNDAFRAAIARRGAAPGTVELLPNGTTREWVEAGTRHPQREAIGYPDSFTFVWAYAGNLGLAHRLEDAIEAARILGNGFKLVLIGDGPRRAELERLAQTLPPGRVELRGSMPAPDAARHLRAADALFLSEHQRKTVSSKLYDYCAIGRPAIAACRGHMSGLVEREGIALPVEFEDPTAIAAAVRRVREEAELRAELVSRARGFAVRHLREHQTERLGELLESLAGGPVSDRERAHVRGSSGVPASAG